MYIYFHSLQSPYVSLKNTIFTKEKRKLRRYLIHWSVKVFGIWKIKPNSSRTISKKNIFCLTENNNAFSKQGVYSSIKQNERKFYLQQQTSYKKAFWQIILLFISGREFFFCDTKNRQEDQGEKDMKN